MLEGIVEAGYGDVVVALVGFVGVCERGKAVFAEPGDVAAVVADVAAADGVAAVAARVEVGTAFDAPVGAVAAANDVFGVGGV